MTVVDASVVVIALLGTGDGGRWAEDLLAESDLVAPHLMPVEVTNIVRRAVANGALSADHASLALEDLDDLGIPLHSFGPLRRRVWELRDNVTAYDAWYVALAEALEVPLATLDHRLVGAPGPRCRFRTV